MKKNVLMLGILILMACMACFFTGCDKQKEKDSKAVDAADIPRPY